MKKFGALIILSCAALLIAGCAFPLGEDYTLIKKGNVKEGNTIYIVDYDLQDYVPIPDAGEKPVVSIGNRGDLDVTVEWQTAGVDVSQPFNAFLPDTFYTAEIRLSAKPGHGFLPSTSFAYHPGKIQAQTSDLGNPIRTVMVSYNSSDEADLTYITDYNLQTYVPVPLAGESPVWNINTRGDMTVEALWKAETHPGSGSFTPLAHGDAFALSTVYQAVISLDTNTGYRFFAARNFAYTGDTTVIPNGSVTDPEHRSFIVSYKATRTPILIDDLNLTPYITRPVSGATAVIAFAGSQYTGTVIWKDTITGLVLTSPFLPLTSYTADLTLVPASGYTLTGVGQNVFVHTGAEDITNPAGSGNITIIFPSTGTLGSLTVVYDRDLTKRIPKPVSGMTPVMGITTAQYAGAVTWVPYDSAFRHGTVYKAVINLNAAAGYIFAGVGQNTFTHADAFVVTNPANSGTVTIIFPATASDTYRSITSFGPVADEQSALYLMREKHADTYPLFIDLPDNRIETVDPDSVILLAGQNSPPRVTISGHHGILKIESPGTLLTVGGGVTLTLQNITLEGTTNHAPLVTVQPGGRLILGTGVTLTGNHSSGNIGGVWINGGELVLDNGATIQNMSAGSTSSGGGVRVDLNGKFTMNGGIVGSNVVSATNSGGGVYVNRRGIVSMSGGSIESNRADGDLSGGGVYVLPDGIFNLSGGSIKGNEASYPSGFFNAGGVLHCGWEFNMTGGTIGGDLPGDANHAASGANGVCATSVFRMSGGIVKGNVYQGTDNYGVYIAYTGGHSFIMSEWAQVDRNNPVFLEDNTFLGIGGDLHAVVAANIICGDIHTHTDLIHAYGRSLIVNNYQKFLYNGEAGHINPVPIETYYAPDEWAGVYLP